ncbi:MAG TPA: hypothetical protein VN249_10810, partial [Prolixibacteraceae bacterium]|nr:hypothetical protein [Prolixibacteraceae bacterium]
MGNKKLGVIGLLFCMAFSFSALSQNSTGSSAQNIAIEWQNSQPEGTLEVANGRLVSMKIKKGKGQIRGNSFAFKTMGMVRLECTIANVQN